MSKTNDLFNLTGFESKQDDDILDMNINEEGEFDNTNNIEEILEATRYDLEFEKALDDYKAIWNSYKNYEDKLSKLKNTKKSPEYEKKIDDIIKNKKDELVKSRKKLIDDFGKTIVAYEGDPIKVSDLFKRKSDVDPRSIQTKKKNSDVVGDNIPYQRSVGKELKDTEWETNLHGARDSDGSEKAGRYNMKESADEFADKNPSTNNPEEDFDTNATSAKETNIPVPGSDKETPSAKPEGGEKEIPVPGGDKEAPSAHAVDGATIPTPAKVILSQDTYNDALSSLKKSFKEGYEIMELLEKASIQTKSTEELQREFTENAIDEAIYTSMINGPIFEAVAADDKDKVKGIIKKLVKKVEDFAKDDGLTFYKPAKVIRLIAAFKPSFFRLQFSTADNGINANGSATMGLNNASWWNTRFWQVLGALCIEDDNIGDYTNKLTKEFSEDLGEYKIIAVKMPKTVFDIFRVKFNWKNRKNSYFLLVDKKLNSEIKKAIKELETAVSGSVSDKKNEVVTESVYDFEE